MPSYSDKEHEAVHALLLLRVSNTSCADHLESLFDAGQICWEDIQRSGIFNGIFVFPFTSWSNSGRS